MTGSSTSSSSLRRRRRRLASSSSLSPSSSSSASLSLSFSSSSVSSSFRRRRRRPCASSPSLHTGGSLYNHSPHLPFLLVLKLVAPSPVRIIQPGHLSSQSPNSSHCPPSSSPAFKHS